MDKDSDITRLLQEASAGHREAEHRLFTIVYAELRRLADVHVRNEPSGRTLQATALVHEAWIRLAGKTPESGWQSRAHFFAMSARAMRMILVDAARARLRLKRGGNREKHLLTENELVDLNRDEDLVALDEVLELFRDVDPIKADLVNLRYFAGLTQEQAAQQLDISLATAERYWTYAKAWLRSKIEGPDQDDGGSSK